ncbi:hypothetical protein FS837_001805 [Tulasnella sp. UAMH 9824]|nr:hypothetical protein FS837_001805 [Tulasnella sp. UAMH 9824]
MGSEPSLEALRLARELKVWAKANHPNILELIGYHLSENYVLAQFVSAFMANGNVMQYIQRTHASIVLRLKFVIVRDITAGLNYLHEFSPPICHGDLKPANVLVKENVDAVLCDFGLSSFIYEPEIVSGLTTSKSIKGATRYMSPELVRDESKHTLQSDVWAWGCTTLEIVTGTIPYSNRASDLTVLMDILANAPPGPIDTLSDLLLDSDADPASSKTVSSLRSIILQCWDVNPTNRPSSSGILQKIAIPDKPEARVTAVGVKKTGISSPGIGDDFRGGASKTQIAKEMPTPSPFKLLFMSQPNVRNGSTVVVPDLDQHAALLREVLGGPGAANLRPNLLDALDRLKHDLTPPVKRHGFQYFVWQRAAENGLTVLLLNATTDVVKLDQQGTISTRLFSCIRSIFVAGVETKHFTGHPLLRDRKIVDAAVETIPRVIHEWLSKFRGGIMRGRTGTSVLRSGILESLVDLGCIEYQAREDTPALCFHAL